MCLTCFHVGLSQLLNSTALNLTYHTVLMAQITLWIYWVGLQFFRKTKYIQYFVTNYDDWFLDPRSQKTNMGQIDSLIVIII